MEEAGKIQNWKTLFTSNALSVGEGYWKRGRVADLKVEEDGYSGAVTGDKRYEVRIRKNADGQLQMHCTCPQANGGGRCRHMAAVCYAIEAEKATPKRKEESEMVVLNPGAFPSGEERRGQGVNRAKDSYSYFDVSSLRQSLDLTPQLEKKGLNHCKRREIVLDDIQFGYSNYEDGLLGEVEGRGIWKEKVFPIHMVFSNERVLNVECHCPDCRNYYYGWYDRKKNCSWTAGLFCLVEDYLKFYRPGDATDRMGTGGSALFSGKTGEPDPGVCDGRGRKPAAAAPAATERRKAVIVLSGRQREDVRDQKPAGILSKCEGFRYQHLRIQHPNQSSAEKFQRTGEKVDPVHRPDRTGRGPV